MEITGDIAISVEERTLLDMHSVLNVLNVLVFELMYIGDRLNGAPEIQQLQNRILGMAETLRDPEEAHRQVENVDEFIQHVNGVVAASIATAKMERDPQIVLSRENIRSVFEILEVRAAEIVARHTDPDGWVTHEIAKLRNNFINVFRAIEKNSKGGYRIVYNLAQHEEGNYLINFDITSAAGSTIAMPAVFQDVMRDLLANARKYTAPGGTINGGLYNSGSELQWVVSDTGVGIPQDEIKEIVAFGFRGSNVKDRETKGGGFGLTKAYYVAKRFGGRMWIDSPAIGGLGTRIEIRIPV
jgi:signal transduction histidine kinase